MFICTLGTYLCAHDVRVCMRGFNYCCLSQMHATNIFAVFFFNCAAATLHCELQQQQQQQRLRCSQNRLNLCASVHACERENVSVSLSASV